MLARVAIGLALVAGCSQSPVESGSPGPSGTPGATPVPAPSGASTPAATEHVAIHWEPWDDLAAVDDVMIVHGDAGWVAYGNCEDGSATSCPTVWTSDDTQAWTAHALGNAENGPFGLAANGSGFVAAASVGYSPDGPYSDSYRFWRSTDGETWDAAGTFVVDTCKRPTECLSARGLGLAPSGAIVVGDAYEIDAGELVSSGPYVGGDGGEWRQIGATGIGVDVFKFQHIATTDLEVLLAGNLQAGADARVWSSTDGVTWRDTGELTSGEAPRRSEVWSLTSHDGITVAAVNACGSSGCGTELWSAVAGGPWTLREVRTDISETEVVFTGTAFVAVGIGEADAILASLDGVTWMDVASDGMSTSNDEDCGPAMTAGDGTILLRTAFCGNWRGTVEIVPGGPPVATDDPGPPSPEPTMWNATLEPGARFEPTVELIEACRIEAGRGMFTVEASWTGDVPILDVHYATETSAGSVGFPATTAGSQQFAFEAWTGVEQVITVQFFADSGDHVFGPLVAEIERPFSADPEERCS